MSTSETQFSSVLLDGGVLQYSTSAFDSTNRGHRLAKIPLLNILWAGIDDKKNVIVSLLDATKGKWVLRDVQGPLQPKDDTFAAAEEWTKSLMNVAYAGLKRCKRLRVLINPVGGKGKAEAIYAREVKPIFDAAHCELDVTVTDHHGHMVELAEKMSLDYDAIVVLSGDGGIHEVINGLAKHPQANKALRIPIAQIPTGSANAVCINTLGPKDGFNVAKACLNVIKGRPMKQNVYSIIQGDKTYLSFLTQAAGLMADLDLGTEKLRWMGDGRFILGYLKGVVTKNICPIEVEYKLVEGNKQKMISVGKENAAKAHFYEEDASAQDHDTALPWSEPIEDKSEGWTKFDKPIIYLYAGGMPYVSRDLMQFPMSTPAEECIDVVIQAEASRGLMLKATMGAEKGEQYWIESQVYLKVSALRVKPTGRGNLAVDGEHYPFEAFELRVHSGILRFLSLEGRYVTDAFAFDRVPTSGTSSGAKRTHTQP